MICLRGVMQQAFLLIALILLNRADDYRPFAVCALYGCVFGLFVVRLYITLFCGTVAPVRVPMV